MPEELIYCGGVMELSISPGYLRILIRGKTLVKGIYSLHSPPLPPLPETH